MVCRWAAVKVACIFISKCEAATHFEGVVVLADLEQPSMGKNMHKLSPQPYEALKRALFFKGMTFPLLDVWVSFFPYVRMHLTVS